MGSTSRLSRFGHSPRTKPPQERRDELMAAAKRLFLAHGVAETAIEQITEAAGVAKGTFYLYFSSKEDVVAALARGFAEDLVAKIKTSVAKKSVSDWRGKLMAWADACVEGYLDSRRLHHMLFFGPSRPQTRKGLTSNIVVDDLASLLAAGAKARAWRVEDPHLTAIFTFSGVHGLVHESHSLGARRDRARLVRAARQLSLRAAGLSPI